MDNRLYLPSEMAVSAGAGGEPVAVSLKGRPVPVARISNAWRIDEEWWRQEIARMYFELELANGSRLTVFQDLVTGRWYRQRL